MYVLTVLFSLVVAASASKPIYTVPNHLKAVASNCTLPAEFVVTNFTTSTNKNGTLDTVCFQFSDPDTEIQTTCQRNSTPTPSGPSKNIYRCDNVNIAFIYQTTGIAGLTLTEKACPGASSPQFEASGLVTPELDCTDIPTGTICHAEQRSLQGDFDSFQPIPPTRRSTAPNDHPLSTPKSQTITLFPLEMLFIVPHLLHLLILGAAIFAFASPVFGQDLSLRGEKVNTSDGISVDFFASLERLSRLVDITYCVGTTGIRQPFSCISRCKDFPSLELVTTWSTGALLSDSCGYVAVDHGVSPPIAELYSVPQQQQQEKPNGKANGAIIVAFRGTYSIANAVIDLSTVPQKYVPYPPEDDEYGLPPREPEHVCTNCTVHMGFLLSWQIARRTVLPELKRLHERYPHYPIHVVGHSLGGAVGALAALEMKVIMGWERIIVTTFGEPRVGNAGFVKYLDVAFRLQHESNDPEQRVYRRITHVDDPVPLLPLSEWGYRSHAGEFFISKPELSPKPSDIRPCVGDYDLNCIAGSDGEETDLVKKPISKGHSTNDENGLLNGIWHVPARFKLWGLLFAHRDYFWRLGLCIPGGDPINWGRDKYPAITTNDEL
ncbi:alpha/beta-hydrolase [Xylaria digitata]|nr:alpha/beta-hydrolase [Xylaria digitata]